MKIPLIWHLFLEETKREPGLFFKNNKPPMILDEVQYITELFPYIKMECDNAEVNGSINMVRNNVSSKCLFL